GSECISIVGSILFAFLISPLFLLGLYHLALSEYLVLKRSKVRKPVIALDGLIIPFIYFFNLSSASTMKEITWRGRKYALSSKDSLEEENRPTL
ncbi:MAG: hypothetical protein QXL16_00140, partial [Candidatus Micrarchaeaceae archaeon]